MRGTTWVYSYDRGGNILQKLAYVLSSDAQPSELRQSLIYEYTDANWKDKLTLFCNDELEYDAIGNLTDDGQWTYTWEKGRQLKSMHNANTGVTMEFKYNHEGIRTQKVKKVNGIVTETTDYILKGKTVAAMKKNTDTYYFTYDASGKPVTVSFNGDEYTYVKNQQGDIVGILDASGNLVVEYKYDAWGDPVSIYSANLTVDPIAFDNPFRYRGYVWDEEIGLYYLRSRYYCPYICRFINSDSVYGSIGELISHVAYVYCKNSPVMQFDSTGKRSEYVKDEEHPLLDYIFRKLYKNITNKEICYTDGDFSIEIHGSTTISGEEADQKNKNVEQTVKYVSKAIGAMIGWRAFGIGKIKEKITSTIIGSFLVDEGTDAIQKVFIDPFMIRPGTYWSLEGVYTKTSWHSGRTETIEIRIYPDYLEVWQSTASTYMGMHQVTAPMLIASKNRD